MVIVNPKVNIAALTKTDLADIFLKKIGSYSKDEKLTPIDQKPNEVRTHFYEKILGKSDAEMKAYWSREIFTGHAYPPHSEEGDLSVKESVSNNPTYVGYIDSTVVDEKVKVVAHVD